MKTSEILDKAADELMIRGQYHGALIEPDKVVVRPIPRICYWVPEGVYPTDTINYEQVTVNGTKVCALGALGLANGYTIEDLRLVGLPEGVTGVAELSSFLRYKAADELMISVDDQAIIMFSNDQLGLDMAEEMRECAKELREKGL